MLKLRVTGMNCGHCEKTVEKAVGDVPGVDRVIRVNRADEEIVVEGDPDPTAVVDVIREEGYEARVA
jgi:copper chaperone